MVSGVERAPDGDRVLNPQNLTSNIGSTRMPRVRVMFQIGHHWRGVGEPALRDFPFLPKSFQGGILPACQRH